MTLRRKLLLTLWGLVVAPLALVAGLAWLAAGRVANDQATADLDQALESLAGVLQSRLSTERLTLREHARRRDATLALSDQPLVSVLAGRAEIGEALSETPRVVLRLLLLGPEVTQVIFPERPGWPPAAGYALLSRAPRAFAGPPPADWQSSGGPGVVFRSTGPVVWLAEPFTGTRPGDTVVVEELSAYVLLRDLVAASLPKAIHVFAAAPEGSSWRLVYHARPELIGKPADLSATPGDALVVRRHEPTGWTLGATTSLHPYRGELQSDAVTVLFFLLLIGVAAGLGVVFATRGTTGAVEAIRTGIAGIARGEFAQRIELERDDEFGQIARHLNRMAEELQFTAESRAVAELSTRLVHDLKGVASETRLLLYNLHHNADDPEFRAEFGELMEGIIARIEALAVGLRGAARPAAAAPAEVDLSAVVRGVLERPLVRARPAVRVQTDLADLAPMMCDEDAVTLVAENLVANAMDAMPDGGVLTVRLYAADSERVLEVQDTGVGMSADFVQSRLFRPFSSTKPRGMGMGMYQVRHAVVRLGGEIEVDTAPGRGTRFRVRLPAEALP